MLRKAYVEVPELPTVEKYVLLDQPGILFINLSCDGNGVPKIVSADATENKGSMTPA